MSGPVVREGSLVGAGRLWGKRFVCGKGEFWAWNEMECVVCRRSYSETNTLVQAARKTQLSDCGRQYRLCTNDTRMSFTAALQLV